MIHFLTVYFFQSIVFGFDIDLNNETCKTCKTTKTTNISYFELKNAHKHFTRYLSKDECLFNFTILFLIKRELERFYKEELQRIIKKFNVGSTPVWWTRRG